MPELPLIPEIVELQQIPHLSASETGALLECPLRVAFDHDGRLKDLQPFAARAVVGTAAHLALATLIRAHNRGLAGGEGAPTRGIAGRAFDDALAHECARRDARIRERGLLPGDSTEPPPALPFYGMTRARLARFAATRFGDRWIWQAPRLATPPTPRPNNSHGQLRPVEAEVPLASEDGLLRGFADIVEQDEAGAIIEEFKTGEPTPERLERWKRQLLIYAKLYRDRYGCVPGKLRLHSLAAGPVEFPYVEEEAASAVVDARNALVELNGRIANGAGARELARPSATACAGCPHRAWCEPYWSFATTARCATDVEGRVLGIDGWDADLQLRTGERRRVEFKALHVLPQVGSEIRVCNAFMSPSGTLACHRQTSVWRVRA